MRLQDSPLILTWSICLSLLGATSAALAQMDKTIEISPVANAPFQAFINVEQSRIQKDGSRIKVKAREMIARDSQGRVFRDFGRQNPGYPIVFVEKYDPTTGLYSFANALRHVSWSGKLSERPEDLGAGYFYDSAKDGNQLFGNELGTKTVDGMSVRGFRETEELADDAGESAVVTKEYWYSDDLHMNLVAEYDYPGKVSQTMTVVEIERREPDRGLFDWNRNLSQPVDRASETFIPSSPCLVPDKVNFFECAK